MKHFVRPLLEGLGRHSVTIFGSQSHLKIDQKINAILIPKWSQNGSPDLPNALQKSVSFFDRFFIDFLDRSRGPKSLKMSTSCTREAHFHKIAFSDSDIFLEATVMKKGSQNGPTIA